LSAWWGSWCALDEFGHHAALGLDDQGQRGDVEQQDVLDLALEHAGLQGGADGDDLVRVYALVGLLAAGQVLDELGDGRHAGGATDAREVAGRMGACCARCTPHQAFSNRSPVPLSAGGHRRPQPGPASLIRVASRQS
jgi:hypothetical protein